MCGRVFYGYGFLIGVFLGYSRRIILGRVNGCELGALDVDFLGNVEWIPV